DLHLYIGRKVTTTKHGLLSDQLALPVVFPNLQALQIFYKKVHCDECQITLKQRSRAELRSDTSNEPDWPGFVACVDATLQCLVCQRNMPQLRESEVFYNVMYESPDDHDSTTYYHFRCSRATRRVRNSKGVS